MKREYGIMPPIDGHNNLFPYPSIFPGFSR
jgi:hypothetical protein